MTSPAGAQPLNDACGQNRAAFTIPGLGGSATGTHFGATRDGSACAGLTGVDVYYYFTPASVGPWSISLCASSPASAFDSVLSIHTDSCPVGSGNYATPESALSSCNDNGSGCIAGLSQINPLPLSPGVTYIIRVAWFAGGPPAPLPVFTLTVVNTSSSGACCSTTGACSINSVSLCASPSVFQGEGTVCSPNPCPQIPVNDACAAAIALPGDAADVLGTTLLATADGSAICGGSTVRDVWYAFTPTTSGAYSLSLCDSAAAWDSVLSVHTGCPGNAANQISGACSDDACPSGAHARIASVTLLGGVTYRVRIAGRSAAPVNAGDFRLRVGPAVGSCCRASDAACWVGTSGECPASDLWTQGNLCAPAACAALIGACCSASTGECSPTTAVGCQLPSVFIGPGLTCEPSPCPPPQTGACCGTGGCCQITIEPNCAGIFQAGHGCAPPVCGPSPTNDDCTSPLDLQLLQPVIATTCLAGISVGVPPASCFAVSGPDLWFVFTPPATAFYVFSTCGSDHDTVATLFSGSCGGGGGGLSELACNDTAQPACGTGDPAAAAIGPILLFADQSVLLRVADGPLAASGGVAVAQVVPESTLGSCCQSDGSCSPTDAANCTPEAVFNKGLACLPNPCPPPLGACCEGAVCLTLTEPECRGPGRIFEGPGSPCNQYPQTTTPCCLADFNHQAGVTIQDLFDFMSAYFAGSPTADINRSGVISVEDIFNFLEAFFRGPC
ncbi:MAG: GC-type dockerin domain-anchored protein [Phycisphaerales bacterium]